jgi:hypothetical protein
MYNMCSPLSFRDFYDLGIDNICISLSIVLKQNDDMFR